MIDISSLVKEQIGVVSSRINVRNLKRFIADNDGFIIFGASEGGISTKKLLEKMNKKVIFFLDNDPKKKGKIIEGIKVHNPSELTGIKDKVLLSSVWFVDIARQLSGKFGLKPIKDYIPFFDIILFLSPFMDESMGYDFILNVERHIEEYQRVIDLLKDNYSREIYLKLIKYRMLALTPELIKKEELPYDSNFYENYPSRMQDVLKGLPNKLGELKTTYAAHFALKCYRFEDFKKGNIVIDGGAWKGDSA